MDNEAEQYLPDRQREINALAGIESNIAGPTVGDSDSSNEEDKAGDKEPVEAVKKDSKAKGDVDSSSDEEGSSEELSESDDEVVDTKKGPGAKQPVTKKAAKKVQKKVLTKADKQAKNEKIKRDLKKEQQELGKMLMTNRQKKLYQEAEKTE